MPFLESLGIDILSQYTMLAFTAMFLFACLLIKNGIVRAFVATIGAVFIVAQIFSLYSTQTFIGYQFLHSCQYQRCRRYARNFPQADSRLWLFRCGIVGGVFFLSPSRT